MFIVTGVWTLEVNGDDGEHCLMTQWQDGRTGASIEMISCAAGTGDPNLSPEHFNWWGWCYQPYEDCR